MKMIANVEFRTHPLIQSDCFVLCNLAAFGLFTRNKIICFVQGDKEVISIMENPTDFLKKIQEMQSKLELPYV